jgi:glutamate-1-semialdehyde 2,1-aminomutase
MEVFDPGARGARIASGGTFSANPVSMTGGLATMQAMTPSEFDRLDALGARLRARLGEVFRAAGVPGQAVGEGSLFRLLFTDRPLRSYRDVDQAAEARMERLFRALLDAGVLLHTTGLGCLSTPMGDREVEEIAVAAEQALGVVGRG